MTAAWDFIRDRILATWGFLAPHWALLLGIVLAAGLAYALGRYATRKLCAAGAQLPALTDPSRCPRCGRELAAGEGVTTRHHCGEVRS